MPFHEARSRTSIPLRNAMPYNVSPRLTVALCPGFGVDTRGGGALIAPPLRDTTLLDPHDANATTSPTQANARNTHLMPRAPS